MNNNKPPDTDFEIRISFQENSSNFTIFSPVKAANKSLAQALWLSEKLSPLPLCSGLGRCGLCKVRFLSPPPPPVEMEEKILGAIAVAQGWRLACRHLLKDIFAKQRHLDIELPLFALPKAKNIKYNNDGNDNDNKLLAIDMGTTSICWRTLSPHGKVLQSGKYLNPLMGAGADIISRLRYAMQPEGAFELAHILQEDLQELLHKVTNVSHICLAANTAMSSLFLHKDISSLAHSPYALPFEGHSTEYIKALPPIYFPPQPAPFVGGDISAGYTAVLQREDLAFPFIFADLGTNGEFILALSPKEALLASVPMGPSLEGIGLRFGHVVDQSPGIVNKVSIGATGLIPHTLDGTAAQSLCGTGYISLIHALLKVGIIAHDGTFIKKPMKASPLYAKIAKNFQLVQGDNVLFLWKEHSAVPMYISAVDIEEILKVKAAFSLAIDCLLKSSGLCQTQVQRFYLAGAMGSHIDIQDLEALGFVHYGAASRIRIVGNSALDGAALLAITPSLREELQNFSRQCRLLNLTDDPHFTEKFLRQMNFSYAG